MILENEKFYFEEKENGTKLTRSMYSAASCIWQEMAPGPIYDVVSAVVDFLSLQLLISDQSMPAASSSCTGSTNILDDDVDHDQITYSLTKYTSQVLYHRPSKVVIFYAQSSRNTFDRYEEKGIQ